MIFNFYFTNEYTLFLTRQRLKNRDSKERLNQFWNIRTSTRYSL